MKLTAVSQVNFETAVNFTRNKYTALYVLAGSVIFKEKASATFDSNIGYSGGAIALYSFSTIVVDCRANLTFTKNRAYSLGGGIYYHTLDQHNFVSINTHCFIRTKKENTSQHEKAILTFEGNTATIGGNSIYSDSFKECFQFCKHQGPSTFDYFNYFNTFNCLGNFSFDKDENESNVYALNSSGKDFNFTENNTSLNYLAIPGSTLKLHFTIIDDYNHTVHTVVYIKGEYHSTITLKKPYGWSDTIYPIGEPNSTSNFTVTAFGIQHISFTFTLTLLMCPPGFHFNVRSCTCKCAAGKRGYGMVQKCTDFEAQIKAGYWVGYIPVGSLLQEDLYYAPCPNSMCRIIHSLNNSSLNLDNRICQGNRTGILCGQCVQNFSVYQNSRGLKCGHSLHCKYGLLFYFLSEVIPMVIFFLVVVTFDISFTSGSMTGFILFSQHLVPLEIDYLHSLQHLQTPYRIFYGLFNFDYFVIEQLSFCLWRDFQVLDVITFNYITIAIGFGLVLVFIAIVRNTRVRAINSIVHGLSAFLVICYAQCTKTSFYILKYVRPNGYNGTTKHSYSYYGGLIYFSPQHMKYAVPALLSLLVITFLPPLILILNPLALKGLALCGLSEHRLVNKILQITRINKVMPFIDCFQGCYKDKLRFFAGLYFVYRVVILLCFLLVQEEHYMKLYTLSTFLLILGIHCVIQPYKRPIHNTINSLVLLDLALISVCSIFASSIKSAHESTYDSYFGRSVILFGWFQLILIYLPMLVAIFVVGRRVFIYLKNRRSTSEEEMHDSADIDVYRHGSGYERLD